MTLTVGEVKPGGKFTPPVKESLRGGVDRTVPLTNKPDISRQFQGEKVRFAFEEDLPPDEDFAPYDEPVLYWEPWEPGIELQPWALLQAIPSSNKGQWICRNKVEEDAVRARLAPLTGGNPDKLKMTASEKQAMTDPELRTDCGTCQFQTTSNLAWNFHKAKWGHQ